jgi:hypothetical protein
MIFVLNIVYLRCFSNTACRKLLVFVVMRKGGKFPAQLGLVESANQEHGKTESAY